MIIDGNIEVKEIEIMEKCQMGGRNKDELCVCANCPRAFEKTEGRGECRVCIICGGPHTACLRKNAG